MRNSVAPLFCAEPPRGGSQVAFAKTRGLSQRRACQLLSVARSTLGYESRLAVKDAPVKVARHRLASDYPRFGYRRINIFLGR